VVLLLSLVRLASVALNCISKFFGIVYALVTILGFLGGGIVLGMMMNMADNVLHLVITVFALYYGFRNEGGATM